MSFDFVRCEAKIVCVNIFPASEFNFKIEMPYIANAKDKYYLILFVEIEQIVTFSVLKQSAVAETYLNVEMFRFQFVGSISLKCSRHFWRLSICRRYQYNVFYRMLCALIKFKFKHLYSNEWRENEKWKHKIDAIERKQTNKELGIWVWCWRIYLFNFCSVNLFMVMQCVK